jgi:hypothetical protein
VIRRPIIEDVLATADDDGFASFLHLSHGEVKRLAAEIRALQQQTVEQHVASLVAAGWRDEQWVFGAPVRVLVAPTP